MSTIGTPDSASKTALLRQQQTRFRRRVFLVIAAVIVSFYGVIFTYHLLTPTPSQIASLQVLEQCREICLKYGLIPTGNIKQDAEAYLEAVKKPRLSEPLRELLADGQFIVAESRPHPLLKQPAPDFQLKNHEGQLVSLQETLAQGPVVLVFYYGYDCSHCVAQLFGLQEDLKYFQELGARIVAISADPPEETKARFEEYGAFNFTVLSDPENKIAQQYGVFIPETAERPSDLKHGTFLINPAGKVFFSTFGYKPFLDNKSLLFMLNEFSQQSSPEHKSPNET